MMTPGLLHLARDLARREPGRPRSVSLRRAVSSAYYALFHALAHLTADQLVGWRKPHAVFTPVYRSLDHARARSVLNAHHREGPKGGPTETIAIAFVALQEARFDADYNPEPFRYTRGDTIELIELAEQAVTAIANLSAEEKLALAVKLIVKSR